MKTCRPLTWRLVVFTGLALALPLSATQPSQQDDKKPQDKKEFGPKDFLKKDFGFGPGGFGGPKLQQRQVVKQFDKNGDGWLNAEERAAAREMVKKQPGGFGMKGPGFKGKGPGGMFGPGRFLAKPIMEAIDADSDGLVTSGEFLAGVKKFFAESDRGKRGRIDEKQLAANLNRIFPAPPGGAGPGGPPGGPGGKGPGEGAARNIVKRSDADQDGMITLAELTVAAEAFFKEIDKDRKGKLNDEAIAAAVGVLMPPPGGGFGPGGGMFGKGGMREPGKPGPRVTPADVSVFPTAPLYDTSVLRTLFIDFENKDWEAELQDFHGTDVEVPATLTVDGKKYPNVGIHFRGMSSYMMVPMGSKRSLGVAIDLADAKQRLYGFKTLNLLNSADDPSLMHTVLFSHIARQYIPTPKANYVKVVINGESWGIYVNAQQFNKDFVAENFKTTQGARWRIKGSPGGRGGLDYLGDNIDDYKRIYTIKTKDNDKDWKALIALCRTLSETPLDQLEEALKPMLDIDGALRFLALDNALINDDGYWVRASDYSLYRDPKGKFHLIPHDLNETFSPAMGFGFGPGMGKGPKGPGGPKGGPEGPKDEPPDGAGKGGPKNPFGGPKGGPGGGLQLDPLIGIDDTRKPLRGRLLKAPNLRTKYLQYVREIAQDQLDWKKLGPMVAQHRALIEKEIELDTRKLYSLAAFRNAVADGAPVESAPSPMGKGSIGLKAFADGRRAYLLNHPEIRKLGTPSGIDERKGGEE